MVIEERFGLTDVDRLSFKFTDKIRKFSRQLRKGDYASPKYYSGATICKWSLAICENEDKIDIFLQREDYTIRCQDLDVKICIVDGFGFFSFYPMERREKVKFSPDNNTVLILSVSKDKLFHDNMMLNRIRFLPCDTLTVKCEVTSYQSSSVVFESKYDFYSHRIDYEWCALVVFLAFMLSVIMFCTNLIFFDIFVKPLFMEIVTLLQFIMQNIVSLMKIAIQIFDVPVGYVFIFAISTFLLVSAIVILHFMIEQAKHLSKRRVMSISKQISEQELADLIDHQTNVLRILKQIKVESG